MTGTALLLYSGEGVLRAVGFLTAVTLAAAGAGIWGGAPGAAAGRSAVARRWGGLVIALLLAGAFIVVWDRVPGLTSLGGSTTLAALVILAVPAYAAGATLTALAVRDGSTMAAVAILGAGLGALGTTTLLVPRLDAAAVYFLAGAWVAAAAMLPGSTRSGESKHMDLEGRTVLITGAGDPGQVGFVVAQRCVAAGARVVITSRSPTVVETAAQLGPESVVLGVPADLAVAEDLHNLARTVRERCGGLQVLMNVAGGLSIIKPLADTSSEEWRREIERNADTVHAASRAMLPLLRESGGAIINFASPAGLRAARNLGAYSAAKAAVVAHTRALALEEKANGVRVNAIAPGMIDTAQNRASVEDPDATRWVTREEIADAAIFLASDAAAGISGETIHVLGDGLH